MGVDGGVEMNSKFKRRWSFAGAGRSEVAKRIKVVNNVKFLRGMVEGVCLNVCCGLDPTGDVKVDVDLGVLMEQKARFGCCDLVLADMRWLPFREKSFDTVICDPPFKYYSKVGQVIVLKNYARRRLLLSAPTVAIRLGKEWERELYAIETTGMFLRLWYVFTRRDDVDDGEGVMTLDTFMEGERCG